ncbi:hypothetical protein B5X24_HaOG211254 [Helicoverpa armigera]|uniref:Uncharacterized protein n=1 Tax=Helicoverpa armigera TaxID=29058 RepID=A0A2W1BI20_HELAM|nr:hypothetical protein B5X24_HaOG211254 [Helicoverpa armigera]
MWEWRWLQGAARVADVQPGSAGARLPARRRRQAVLSVLVLLLLLLLPGGARLGGRARQEAARARPAGAAAQRRRRAAHAGRDPELGAVVRPPHAQRRWTEGVPRLPPRRVLRREYNVLARVRGAQARD